MAAGRSARPGQAENSGEADLSTQPTGAQASPRIPNPDGHQGRPQGPQCPSGARSRAAERLSRSLAAPVQRLRRRADFLDVATGPRAPAAAFVLQARERADTGPSRVGFTVSKRVGNAVERNRVRRRLREVVRLSDAGRFRPGNDYVLVGRRAALDLPFRRLIEDFLRALDHVHGERRTLRASAARRGGDRVEASPTGDQKTS